MPVGSVDEGGEEGGEEGGGVWEEVEAVCMFGVQVRFERVGGFGCRSWHVRVRCVVWSVPVLEGVVVSAGFFFFGNVPRVHETLAPQLWHVYAQEKLGIGATL